MRKEPADRLMKLSDLIVGIVLILCGTIVYLTNYHKNEKQSKMRARIGLGTLIIGTLLSFGQWVFQLVLSGN